MQRQPPGDAIPLVVRQAGLHGSGAPRIPARWLFVATMAVATTIALAASLPLGFGAATGAAFDSRWTEAVQAHGRIQLHAWATPIVVALGFEFLPRLNGRPWLPAAPRLATLALLFLGAGAQAVSLFARAGWLMLPATIGSLAGSVLFALLVYHLRSRTPPFANPQALFMPVASLWLVAASGAAVASELRTSAQIVPLQDSRLVVELVMRGFLLHAVIAIGLRAFPGHLGLPAVGRRTQGAVLVALSLSVGCWAAGSGAVGLPDSEALRRLGDGGLAAAIAGITLAMRVFSAPPAWRGLPRYRLLVPLAWSALIAYAAVIAVAAVRTDALGFTLYEQGAIRHVFLLGFLAPLVFAMGHIVLARFAVGFIPSEGLLTAAALLTWLAWPFRVLPMLWVAAPGDAAHWSMGVAGALAFVAFALALTVLIRVTLLLTVPQPPHVPEPPRGVGATR